MKDKLIDKLGFEKLLGISALAIALVSAFFSVYGIATLFAGAFVLTAFMASALEIGKLVAVTFLYRHWDSTHKFLKIYLCVATSVLMIITSLGIFGYLSSAYQKSALEFKTSQEKISLIEGKKVFYTDKIAEAQARIKTLDDARASQELRMNQVLTNRSLSRSTSNIKQLQQQTIDMVTTANADIKTQQATIDKAMDDIQQVNEQVTQLKVASAGTKDIRTFQFVADQFGTTLDTVAKWFILTIICVFDPLAIALILAYNVATHKKYPAIQEESAPKELILNTAPPSVQPSKIVGVTHDVDGKPIPPRPTWLQ